ncbi:MAG: protein-L-isoaspartate(D-aspartate) O-methyltransferase [Desulfuromonadaceae bacterium]|nr:protein-L-isoaspartate(D-aspartate) O-methyltransferase [Desulfuromonadaceae bacterium]
MNFTTSRNNMVERQLKARGIADPLVVDAMLRVPRHLFVEEALRNQAYSDFPLPIGEGQTISQPYMVAMMTEALLLVGGEKVLEIGTGSGYQAAVLSRIAAQVYTIERSSVLARKARAILDSNGYANISIRVGDGTLGWSGEAPFDAIMVTAGAPAVVEEIKRQLAINGRLVIPVGSFKEQVLKRVIRLTESDFREENLLSCRFVPLLGRHGWQDVPQR